MSFPGIFDIPGLIASSSLRVDIFLIVSTENCGATLFAPVFDSIVVDVPVFDSPSVFVPILESVVVEPVATLIFPTELDDTGEVEVLIFSENPDATAGVVVSTFHCTITGVGVVSNGIVLFLSFQQEDNNNDKPRRENRVRDFIINKVRFFFCKEKLRKNLGYIQT